MQTNENYYKNLHFALYNHKLYIQTFPCLSPPLKTTTTTTSNLITHASPFLMLFHPSTGSETTWAIFLPALAGMEPSGFTKSSIPDTPLVSPKK